ncbi:MAG: peroxiredoxin-like family protein [Capsulimonadaceae bacterium]
MIYRQYVKLVPAIVSFALAFAAMQRAGLADTINAMSVPIGAEATHPLMSGKVPAGQELRAINGTAFSLNAAIRAHPTILIFYRGGWCPFCNMHLGALQKIAPDLDRLGYRILAISPDPGPELQKTIEKHAITYTLLTDPSMSVSKSFGLAYRVDDATLTKMKGFGIDLESRTGLHPPMLPVPAAYVVDTQGNIRFAYANPDFRTRVDPARLLTVAKSVVALRP